MAEVEFLEGSRGLSYRERGRKRRGGAARPALTGMPMTGGCRIGTTSGLSMEEDNFNFG